MLTALILVCSTTVTDLAACTRENATTVMRVPLECGTPATCFMNAQAYLAQTSLGQDLGPDGKASDAGAAFRHVSRLVPVQHIGRRIQVTDLA